MADTPLKDDWEDSIDFLYAEQYNLHTARTNGHSIRLDDLETEIDGIPGVNDDYIAALIANDESATAQSITDRFVFPPELATGPAPVCTVHPNAGSGAVATFGGTRLGGHLVVETGPGVIPGGVLAELSLTGYTFAPVVGIAAENDVSALTRARVNVTSSTIQVVATSELEPATTYNFALSILGF